MFQKISFALFAALLLQTTLTFAQDIEPSVGNDGILPSFGKLVKINGQGRAFSNSLSFPIQNFQSSSKKVFILIRHAEKQPETAQNNNDPFLTRPGEFRASNLAELLQAVRLTKVLSTQTNRTKGTAEPTAKRQKLPIEIYGNDHQTMLNQLLSQSGNKKYLIVGHSNTVPMMLNYLTNTDTYTELQGFDNLFVVVSGGVGNSRVYAFKY